MKQLGLPFIALAPGVDETPLGGESPEELARRLAVAKAGALSQRFPDAIVVGSDQVASLDGEPLGKPGNAEENIRQLLRVSDSRLAFLTSLCVTCRAKQHIQVDVVPYFVTFRRLTRTEVECYVHRERAFDCAGGFKCEGLGIALLERMEGDDPAALVGLPLIRLMQMLAAAGVDVLDPKAITQPVA